MNDHAIDERDRLGRRHRQQPDVEPGKAGGEQLLHHPHLKILHQGESQINMPPLNAGFKIAVVYTRRFNDATMHPRIMHIHLRPVKATAIIDGRHQVFQRKIGFQIQALIALHGIARGMAFCKSVIPKTLNLPPHFCRHLFSIATFQAVAEKLLFDGVKSIALPEFPAHSPAQDIRFGQGEPCKIMRHLQHVFLIYHHAKSLSHQFPKCWMNILPLVRLPEALDVLLHHATLCHARTNNRACRHQS